MNLFSYFPRLHWFKLRMRFSKILYVKLGASRVKHEFQCLMSWAKQIMITQPCGRGRYKNKGCTVSDIGRHLYCYEHPTPFASPWSHYGNPRNSLSSSVPLMRVYSRALDSIRFESLVRFSHNFFLSESFENFFIKSRT